MAPLHNQRRKLADRAAREEAGESFWTEEFSPTVRNRVRLIMEKGDPKNVVPSIARGLILEDEGIRSLTNAGLNNYYDFFRYLETCSSEMAPTVLEAFYLALKTTTARSYGCIAPEVFAEAVNGALSRERVAYELIEGQAVPFSSREMHVEVVEPVLRLLSQPGWESVEAAYQAALGELVRGEGANAITDAGTALQAGLEKLGASGNALGPLIASARQLGLFGPNDSGLANSVRAACDWVSGDRSVNGDAHNANPASVEDAWLTIHIVGALLLRLSSNAPPRGGAA